MHRRRTARGRCIIHIISFGFLGPEKVSKYQNTKNFNCWHISLNNNSVSPPYRNGGVSHRYAITVVYHFTHTERL
jgi:hypothetical protein